MPGGRRIQDENLRLSPPQLRRGACPRLSKGNKSKCKPYSELRLTRKSTAAAEVLRLEERRANTQIAARIVEVCVVGQVEELGSEVDRALLTEPLTIGDPQIRLKEIRTVRAIDATVVFDVLKRAQGGATIGASGQRVEKFSVPVRVDIRVQNCERRAAHVPRRGAQVHAVRLRNLHAAAEGENVAPVNRHRSPELVEIQVSPDLQEVLVQLVQCGAARGRQGIGCPSRPILGESLFELKIQGVILAPSCVLNQPDSGVIRLA